MRSAMESAMRVGRSMVGWTVGFGNFGKWWNKSVTSLRVVKLKVIKRT